MDLAADDGTGGLVIQNPQVFARFPEREFFIENLLVRTRFIVVMIRWTGLAPWEVEFPFPGSLQNPTKNPFPPWR